MSILKARALFFFLIPYLLLLPSVHWLAGDDAPQDAEGHPGEEKVHLRLFLAVGPAALQVGGEVLQGQQGGAGVLGNPGDPELRNYTPNPLKWKRSSLHYTLSRTVIKIKKCFK